MKHFLATLFIWSTIGVSAQNYIVISPHHNTQEVIYTTSGTDSNPYHFSPTKRRGQAFRFATIEVKDTALFAQRFPPVGYPNPQPAAMEMINKWEVSYLDSLFSASHKDIYKMQFLDVMQRIIGTDFGIRKEKAYAFSHLVPYRENLDEYIYRGKHCLLLWDNPHKCVRLEKADTETYLQQFDFDYSLRDAKQIVLCQYSEDCYVLLLLTERAVFENK